MSPFLNPLIAWSAFGLASIPIIIHLLNRRRLRRIDWAAMEFLLAALKKNKRRVRLEQLILLLVRIALMILLALFISRPIFDSRGLGWLAGALSSEEKIFVLDDSLSMSQRAADRPIFARALGALA
ncbi:MAG TPA: BatA domain-containing protein, partial [Planctomycetota bacterium]|nr:BatA domain-containing protein [Planctomycetota bacterium]